MANEGYIIRLQDQIGYRFNDITLLERALTAPGVEGEKEGLKEERSKYEGNRKLAQLGDSILHLIVLQRALFEEDSERSRANDALKFAALKEHHKEIARSFQIDTHMKLSPRQKGRASTRTLSLAVCAVFGACFIDSGSISVVRRALERFGIGSNLEDPERYIDPIKTHRQEQIAASELVSGVFDEYFDVSSKNSTLTSMPVTVDNDRGTGSRVTDIRGFWISGHEDSAMQRRFDPENGDNETTSNTSQEPLNNMRLAKSSACQNFFKDSFLELDSRSGILVSPTSSGFENSSGNPISDIDDSLQDLSEGEYLLHPQMTAMELLSTDRANSDTSGTKSKKRKHPTSRRNKSSSIDAYLLLEKSRCISLGLPCPDEDFKSVMTQASTKSLRLNEFMTELKVFYFAIASPESLAAMNAIIKVQRKSPKGPLSVPGWNLPLAERMKAIENLNENIAYMGFLRRCHTHQIFLDSSIGSKKSSDGFINFTSQSISTRSGPQIGNPNNLENSRVSKLIMKDIYPNLDINGPEYERKRLFVVKLRKLGERLDLLVQKFGFGILGLLPLPTDVPAVEPILTITDSLILKLPDNAFRWLVQCLDQTQGFLLRKTSEAISEIVTDIFQGTLDPLKRFGIEQLEQEEFMKHPKGSPMILDSISKTWSHGPDTVKH